MNLAQYIKKLLFILWNIIVFLCPIMAPQSLTNKKKLSFWAFTRIDIYFYNIFLALKELKKKIIINKNNKADAVSAQITNKNKKQILSILNTNNKVLNKALKLSKLLSYLKLKDARATQNLISKQHIFRLEYKCVYLYPFAVQNYRCSELFLIFT